MGPFRSSIHCTGTGHPSEAGQAICDTDTLKSAIPDFAACEAPQPGAIVTKRVATLYKNSGVRRHCSSRRILVVVVPPVDELDLVGPLQVFNSVNRLAGRNIYAIEVVTNADCLTVEGEGGVLTFMAKHHFDKVEGDCDSVLLVCGLGTRSVRDAVLSAWLRKMASEVRRLGAVCVGAFLLAEAGLLNDRRATTHWRFGSEMAARYPRVRVQHDPLWVKDGNIYTSAGISAGIDLALAWVEEDCGASLAHEAARELVLFLRRPGGQPQLSVSLASQASEMMSIRELQIWMVEHLQTKLSVEDLADRMAMSVRNFERVFTREVGTTPSQYLLQLRVEAARRQLERTERGLKQVASTVGFGNVDVMRRAFVRLLGISPRRYRELAERSTGNEGRMAGATRVL
ncbi:MAG TPA: helix-turn-helix domain-containing protein [Candidatus Sulfotelmatobacter sp.]|nr:helix-turn-helix domain-containing protein [Candidatus Sulfotelmatobacter sp.]